MDGAPPHIGRPRLVIDGVSENVKHSGRHSFADRHLQRPPGIFDQRAARQSLWRSHGDATDASRIQLCPDLDEDPAPLACAQQIIDGGQVVAEFNVDDAAANR